MLFMGEEWGTARPFLFFCDFEPGLAEAVRNGRREEFARFPEFQDPATRERIPDPTAEATFLASKLDWEAAGERRARRMARLLCAGRSPCGAARSCRGFSASAGMRDATPCWATRRSRVDWTLGDGSVLTLLANLSDKPIPLAGAAAGRVIWQEGVASDESLAPWTRLFTLSDGVLE